jgi:hypothetical protein
VPVQTAPIQGQVLSLSLTDAGRVALGPTIGAGAQRLEGVVESVNDSAYVLRMRSVTMINGQIARWTNEQLVVGKQNVGNAKERKFSRTRTAIAAAAAVGSLAVLLASRGLIGGGSESGKGDKGGGGGDPQ